MILQLASDVAIQAIEAPAPSCDWANQITPNFLSIVANIRGLSIVAGFVIVIIGAALLVPVSPFKNARKRMLEIIGWPIVVSLGAAALLAIASSLLVNAC